MARRQHGPQVVGSQTVVARQQQLGRHHVLTHQAHVLPGGGGLVDGHGVPALVAHLLDHDHRVGPGRQRLAGVQPGEAPFGVVLVREQPELPGREFGGPEGILRAHADAVHGGAVVVGRGDPGEHRLGCDPVQGLAHVHRLVIQVRAVDTAQEQLPRLGQRSLLEVSFACHERPSRTSPASPRRRGQAPGHQNSSTSTSLPCSSPSRLRSMRTMPSALTRVKMAPDLLGSGEANRTSPLLSSVTLT